MGIRGVLVRFMPLLDVTIILLGVLMMPLMYTQLKAKKTSTDAVKSIEAKYAIDHLYFYAGWKGDQNGKVLQINLDGTLGNEVATDRPDELRAILDQRKSSTKRDHPVVMLLFADDGWYAAWDDERLKRIEKAWGVRIAPVYNVRLR
jgi:hypothetical protein